MKKAFDQTVRDLKREVNKSVLKVPRIEQKILDATSNEPWGPHGSHLAEIAQATRNHHEYQLIMPVIWKRINDTGKNWRHVYKGLTVLEYLVSHGSERVIDDIREHAYQISTLSDFQYIDSRGKDQGNNVRKKSQSLVALVNDKERIQEVRQKAFANKDKYRSTFGTGGMHRSGSGGGFGDRYDDDRYEGQYRDEDQNGSSRERDGSYRDDDRYGRNGDSFHSGDQYGRDHDNYGRDDDRQGRSRNDDYRFGSRSRSADGDRGRSFDDEDQYSSRSGGRRVDDSSHDDRQFGQKFPDGNGGAPPSYEEATKSPATHINDDRDGKSSAVTTDSAPKASSPPLEVSSHSETMNSEPATVSRSLPPNMNQVESFDEFDPRGSTSATTNGVGVDLFGSFSADDSINSLALVPVTSVPTTSESDVPTESGFMNNFVTMPSTSPAREQPNRDPFGDAPFRASPQDSFLAQSQNGSSFVSQPNLASFSSSGLQPTMDSKVETEPGFNFEESFPVMNAPSNVPNAQPPPAAPVLSTQPSDNLDILFASSGNATPFSSQVTGLVPPARSQTAPPEFLVQSLPSAQVSSQATFPNQFTHPGMMLHPAVPNPFAQSGVTPQMVPQNHFVRPGLSSTASSPTLLGQSFPPTPASQAVPSTFSSVPTNTMQSKDKFETKSTVWADTLSRGLVDLNISGSKISNSVDIGIDFDSINRKEKLKEKKNPIATTPVSTITMGKAMGSGSGIGRSGATGITPTLNPMMAPRMGGGYAGSMNQTMGMGMGMGGYAGGLNQPPMGMGQGGAARPGFGMPAAPGMPGVGGHNPMMGMGGGYGSQQPYGGGYR